MRSQHFWPNDLSFRNKKKSNRFELFICFRNKFFMLQMRLMKKPRVPAPWSETFATHFFLTNEILLHNSKKIKTSHFRLFRLVLNTNELCFAMAYG